MAKRPAIEVFRDDQGQLAAEYVMAILAVVLPLLGLMPIILDQLYTYFYQIVGLLSLPFA